MPAPIKPDVVYELVSVSGPSLAPDASRVAFARSEYDRERKAHRSRIMVAELPGGEPRVFTQGDKDGSPSFSPDGASIAFLRPDERGRKQLWLIPASGGEARQLTTAAGGVTEITWSPDGSRIAFASDVDPDRLPDAEESSEPRVTVVRRIRYRFDTQGWRGNAHTHLFLVDVESGGTRQLTDGDCDDHMPAWSPDSERIAFVSDRSEDRDVTNRREVYVVPADGGEPMEWSQGLVSMLAAAWSPDGRRLAALGTDDPRIILPWQARLFVLEPGKPPSADHRRLRVAGGRVSARADAGHALGRRRRRPVPGRLARREFPVPGGRGRRGDAAGLGRRRPAHRPVSRRRRRPGGRRLCAAGLGRRPARGRPRFGIGRAADLLQPALLRGAPAGHDGEVHPRPRRRGDRVPGRVPAGLRPVPPVPDDPGHSRRASERLLRRLQPDPAGAGNGGLRRAGRQPAGLQRLWHRLRQGGARRLGRRGLPRHHGGCRRDVGTAVRRRNAPGRSRATATAAT